MKCHGAVAGSFVRSSSAHVAASTMGSSPVSPQNRFNCGSMGLEVSNASKACFASGVRCFSASAATVWCPWQPQPRTAGAKVREVNAKTAHAYANLRFIGILLALPRSARGGQNVSFAPLVFRARWMRHTISHTVLVVALGVRGLLAELTADE